MSHDLIYCHDLIDIYSVKLPLIPKQGEVATNYGKNAII